MSPSLRQPVTHPADAAASNRRIAALGAAGPLEPWALTVPDRRSLSVAPSAPAPQPARHEWHQCTQAENSDAGDPKDAQRVCRVAEPEGHLHRANQVVAAVVGPAIGQADADDQRHARDGHPSAPPRGCAVGALARGQQRAPAERALVARRAAIDAAGKVHLGGSSALNPATRWRTA